MSEQNPQNEPETVSSLSRSLTQFIDYVGQSHRCLELQQEAQQTQINTVAQAVQELITLQRDVIVRIDEMQSEVREIQSEVRGLQTENRRMLDLYLNEQEPPDESN